MSINKQIDKENMVNNGILLTIKNNKILPFMTTWMGLKGNIVSKIRQRRTNAVWFHLHIESKKQSNLTNRTKRKQTYKHREQHGSCQRKEGGEVQ